VRSRVALAGLVLSLLLPAFAGSKKHKPEYAVIVGTVWAGERPAAGVPIAIRREGDKKVRWETVSDSRGEFAQRLPAGTADYVITPKLKDKQAAEKAEVKVHIEKDERQDIALHLIEQEQTKN
jgi:hypothetical protein